MARIALLWSQLAPYHVDRCEALGARFTGRAAVTVIEVSNQSLTYAWAPSDRPASTTKQTLFPGRAFETIPRPMRLLAMLRALWRERVVVIGIGYNEPDVVVLVWLLRLIGARVMMILDSKYDDKPRSTAFELFKRVLLTAYSGAFVAAQRQIAYVRFLGFTRRPVLPACDVVSNARVRREAGVALAPEGKPWRDRGFVYVGRFVEKKNLVGLIEGYACYCAQAGHEARTLTLVGSGPEEPAIRAQIARHGLEGRVRFTGFASSTEVSRALAESLALVLVSTVEQWGLVVNEALAVNLPVIVSPAVGARDVLVRNLLNGFVVPPHNPESLAAAMAELASDEAGWRRMCAASAERAWFGDCERFVDMVEVMLDPAAPARADAERWIAGMECDPEARFA